MTRVLKGPLVDRARWLVGRLLDTRVWRPSRAALVWAQRPSGRSRRSLESPKHHLDAAAAWLGRAQDATGDGGVASHYSLGEGWASSYPEITGYIVPTFLELEGMRGSSEWRIRAASAIRFLLSVQLESGAFPAGELRINRTAPSVFNTAQILGGLVAWHRATGDAPALAAARRAADWLVSIQDHDGAWRRQTYRQMITTYTAYASCWLAELGVHVDEPRYRQAAERHVDWVMKHRDPATGWIDLTGFSERDHRDRVAVTQTIGYVVDGLDRSGRVLGRADVRQAARQAALGVLECLERLKWLPGVLDSEWRGQSKYACLTGNAQMAGVWLRLHAEDGDARWQAGAERALELVRRAQMLRSAERGMRGGIAGSDPIWGGYLYCSFPSGAAKFFIDSSLALERAAGQNLAPQPASEAR